MTGQLTNPCPGLYCVEYPDRNVFVEWRPANITTSKLADSLILAKGGANLTISESDLRQIIGQPVTFLLPPDIRKTRVEQRGQLKDGGSIKVVYYHPGSSEPLSAVQVQSGIQFLSEWIGIIH